MVPELIIGRACIMNEPYPSAYGLLFSIFFLFFLSLTLASVIYHSSPRVTPRMMLRR